LGTGNVGKQIRASISQGDGLQIHKLEVGVKMDINVEKKMKNKMRTGKTRATQIAVWRQRFAARKSELLL